MRKGLLCFMVLCATQMLAFAQTENFGTWIELEFTKELTKKLEFSIIPEVRLQDDFTVDKHQVDGKLSFQPISFLELGATYRIKTNVKKKKNEVTHRYIFDASGKTKWGRFRPSLRLRLTNHNDADDDVKVVFLRPRAKLVYDIKGSKFRPYTSYEMYYDVKNEDHTKDRFDVGVTRKLGKLHRVGLYYRLQSYHDDGSINILGINYRLKI